jgi:hypothetical protein
MGSRSLNKYRVTFEDNSSEKFVAQTARAAVNALETDQRSVVQLVREEVGIGVETPLRNVRFVVEIPSQAAIDAGCRAVPETWVVPEGTAVIFTAIAGAGYEFDGWFSGGGSSPLSVDAVAELTVEFPAVPASLATVFEARFSPIIAP